MDRFQSIEAFVRVAQTGSFAEAARQLRVAKSVVTTRVKQLEEHLGAPLFHRSTRVVRLSELGQAHLSECAELLGRANALVDQMRDERSSLSGSLRVQAVPGLVLGHLAKILRAFQAEYPDIRLDVVVSDVVVEPVKAGVDVALQIFPAMATEVIARPLFPIRRVFCATPQYLAERGTPAEPRDLHQHRLGLYSGYPTRDRWTFYKGGAELTLYLNAALLTNSVHLLREYALEHAGIVCLPTLVCGDELARGDLTVLLEDQSLSSFWLSAVYAETARHNPKLRLFMEYMLRTFTRQPPWDKALIQSGRLSPELIES